MGDYFALVIVDICLLWLITTDSYAVGTFTTSAILENVTSKAMDIQTTDDIFQNIRTTTDSYFYTKSQTDTVTTAHVKQYSSNTAQDLENGSTISGALSERDQTTMAAILATPEDISQSTTDGSDFDEISKNSLNSTNNLFDGHSTGSIKSQNTRETGGIQPGNTTKQKRAKSPQKDIWNKIIIGKVRLSTLVAIMSACMMTLIIVSCLSCKLYKRIKKNRDLYQQKMYMNMLFEDLFQRQKHAELHGDSSHVYSLDLCMHGAGKSTQNTWPRTNRSTGSFLSLDRIIYV
ncbi:uncharacterized protein LOC106176026 [Lingula anatina]|uniref:Uncharacterized protein LOC106176026 n=1 Tax=Lingula anatina TaxID=7574 RepID=A0A1S3JUB9_LINAN|nr:uncharacterized protein LOC106176026 [Lingula anatina]|eukprot:XP_013413691.1 uncharacterized protein LOC106176026 [Lingula anatina]